MVERPFDRIVVLETALAPLLRGWSAERTDRGWHDAARAWSAAVWAAANVLGPVRLSTPGVEQGLATARRPVFLCGTHRSGTTLLRDLLDGHPAIVALPSEGSFYTNMHDRLAGLSGPQQVSEMGQEWLRRLVNPDGRQPFWLLGRSSPMASPYVDFARTLMAWWPILRDRHGEGRCLWRLASVALAFGTVSGMLPAATMWAEKTPTNERHLARLWREFPSAKVIQIIRDPWAVWLSHRPFLPGARSPMRAGAAVLRNLRGSYRAALTHSRNASPDRYRLVRYENLVARRQAVTAQLAAFLEIEALPTLLRPSVAGLAASRNSSFAEHAFAEHCAGPAPGRLDQLCLAMAVGGLPARLGYPRP